MRCVAVVPFLNEQAHIGTFLASVDAQTRRPDRLLLVDDGSSDRSTAIAEAFAGGREWAQVRRRPVRPRQRDRLAQAPELAAFLWAAEQLDGDYDVLVKMDADLKLGPRHFERVLDAFAADPGLGMSGTYLFAADADGRLSVERHPPDHVRGPTRFYRRACFEAVSPIPQILGWDGAD